MVIWDIRFAENISISVGCFTDTKFGFSSLLVVVVAGKKDFSG